MPPCVPEMFTVTTICGRNRAIRPYLQGRYAKLDGGFGPRGDTALEYRRVTVCQHSSRTPCPIRFASRALRLSATYKIQIDACE